MTITEIHMQKSNLIPDVELQPNKQFVIHFRLNAADWSNWDTSNDYSMGTEQLLPNDKIIVFYNEQLISGVQP